MTTKYKVQGPDGQEHIFEGPDGATSDQVLAAAQAQFGQGSNTPPAPAPSPKTPQQQAFESGQQTGHQDSGLTAGISQAAQQGTLGLQNFVNAGARWAGQRLTGVDNPDDFSTDLAFSRGRSQGQAEGSPTASTIGGTAGTFMGGAGAAKLLKLAPAGQAVTRFLAPQAGRAAANVLKAGGTAAAAGGIQALAEGQSAPQAGQTAGISALGGAIAPKVLNFAASKLSSASQTAMRTLADNIGETPATLQTAYDSFMKLTGRIPTMAEIVGLKSQGKLKALASANSEIGDAAMTAARAGNAPLHEQLQAMQDSAPSAAQAASVGGTTAPASAQGVAPQTVAGLTNMRDAETTAAMNAPHPQTGVALKDEPLQDPTGVFQDPHIALALQPNQTINARLGQSSPTLDNIQNGNLTINDAETVRKALRDMQNQFSRPAPGSTHMKDATVAANFGNVANQVEQLAGSQVGNYATTLNNHRQFSKYTDAFAHAIGGGSINDYDAGDNLLKQTLTEAAENPNNSAAGLGFQHGQALYQANRALKAIAPGSAQQASTGADAGHVAQGAMAASSGGISAIYHVMRAIPGMHLSQNVQSVIAKQLFNPKTAQQGINNLRRAGIDAQHIREIAGMTGLAAGANLGAFNSNEGAQADSEISP